MVLIKIKSVVGVSDGRFRGPPDRREGRGCCCCCCRRLDGRTGAWMHARMYAHMHTHTHAHTHMHSCRRLWSAPGRRFVGAVCRRRLSAPLSAPSVGALIGALSVGAFLSSSWMTRREMKRGGREISLAPSPLPLLLLLLPRLRLLPRSARSANRRHADVVSAPRRRRAPRGR